MEAYFIVWINQLKAQNYLVTCPEKFNSQNMNISEDMSDSNS